MKITLKVDSNDKKDVALLAKLALTIGENAQTGKDVKTPKEFKPIELPEQKPDPVEADASRKLANQQKPEEVKTLKKVEETPAPKKVAPKKTAAKKSTPVEKTAETTDTQKEQYTSSSGAQEESTGAVDKTALQTKIRSLDKKHRPALKKQLDAYGAANVSTLDEKHYQGFYNFMSELK